MDQNRRKHLRSKPDSFTFIQIERDEIGKILNVSEGGLSFCSFAPVPRNLPIYFWLTFNLKDRIEAMGEVTWTDATRKVGGLRFTHLSPGGQQQIQKWLTRLRSDSAALEQLPVAVGESARQFVARDEQAGIGSGGPDRVARFVAKAHGGGASAAAFIAAPEHKPAPAAVEDAKATTLSSRPWLRIETLPGIGTSREIAPSQPKQKPKTSWRPTMLGLETVGVEEEKVAPAAPPRGSEPSSRASVWRGVELPAARPSGTMLATEVADPPDENPPPVLSVSRRIEPVPRFDSAPRFESPKAQRSGSILSLDLGNSTDSKVFSLPKRGLESLAGLVPLQRHLSAKKRQLILGVLLGICVSAAVAAAALKCRSYYAARGKNVRPAVAVEQAPKNDPQQQAAAATISSPMRSSGEDIFSEGSSYRARSAKSSPGKEVAATYSYTQPRSGPAGSRNAKAPGATRTSDPLRYSQNPTQSKKQKTPEQLWKEVQAGNSQAAVELASLYLKGQGVRQNCQQARVLLLVASSKRDAVAIKKLHELDKDPTTCP